MAIAAKALRKTGAVVPGFSRNEKTRMPPDLEYFKV
jgi:hypothetical protein